MKILHTSDWHLGKRLENFARIEEQRDFLLEIEQIADNNNVDAVIIAGDLFDTFSPPIDALELFYKSLKKISKNGKRPVIAIAGNHDSPDRIAAPDPLAKECGIFLIGYPNTKLGSIKLDSGVEITKTDNGFIELITPNSNIPLRLLHTPYANSIRMNQYIDPENEGELRDLLANHWQELSNKYCDKNGVNILMTHLFVINKDGEQPEEPEDEKPILHVGGAQAIFTENIPTGINYVALGHLHRKQIVNSNKCPIIYSGSPLSYSFAEAQQEKYVILIESNDNKITTTDIKLNSGKSLLRKTFDNIAQAVTWLQENQNCLLELTIKTDDYLSAEDRKALYNAHDGIITIIPEIKNKDIFFENNGTDIDLKKSREELFKEYFFKSKGQEANDSIMNIFKEITAEDS